MLCITDIFLYLDEQLKLTPQAMSDKATPMDELEDMHQRVYIWVSTFLLFSTTCIDVNVFDYFSCSSCNSNIITSLLCSVFGSLVSLLHYYIFLQEYKYLIS